MVVHVYSGLTSRCYTLAQAYYLMKKGGGKNRLLAIWPIDKDCGISYDEIFAREQFQDIRLQVIEKKTRKKRAPDNGGIVRCICKRKYGEALYTAVMKVLDSEILSYSHMTDIILKTYFKSKNKIYEYTPSEEIGWSGERYKSHLTNMWRCVKEKKPYQTGGYVHAYCGMIMDDEREAAKLNTIKFQQIYWDCVEDTIGSGENVIGVHIRRTDHDVAIKNSKTDSFIYKMKQCIAERPQICFFVATDDIREEKNLREVFGDRIIVQKNKVWGRDSKEGMISGLIDCLCLSRCECILGSSTSVFSKFAAEYGDKKLIIC